MDFTDQQSRIGKVISGSYGALTSSAATLSSPTVYDARAYVNGSTLQSWVNGSNALSTTDTTFSAPGFLGLAAYNNTYAYTFTDFSIYTSPTITLSGLPGGGSWSVLNHSSGAINCNTGSTWDASAYTGQIPVDYDNGGGKVAVWTNNNCTGGASAIYPASGLSTDVFGGDTYLYTAGNPGTSAGIVVTASTTISISGTGLISY
jgi:hypothetical protein